MTALRVVIYLTCIFFMMIWLGGVSVYEEAGYDIFRSLSWPGQLGRMIVLETISAGKDEGYAFRD